MSQTKGKKNAMSVGLAASSHQQRTRHHPCAVPTRDLNTGPITEGIRWRALRISSMSRSRSCVRVLTWCLSLAVCVCGCSPSVRLLPGRSGRAVISRQPRCAALGAGLGKSLQGKKR